MEAERAVPGVPAPLQEGLAAAYRIERVVGRGGMATVFLAEDLRHSRPVAIKVLPPELSAREDFSRRFLREVRFASRLVHPHILLVYDSGRTGDWLYYVMPYVSGESLRERLARQGPLPVEEAVRISRAVASALDYAHRHGIIHRDIKPENILLVEEHPVIADFGIARAYSDARDAGAEDITTVGLVIGTPAYMSPEQATGEPNLDGRSDLYSLACVLYEMLAGTTPFPDLPPQVTMLRQMTHTPPPITTVRPDVPADVERVLSRALAKQPEARFATGARFAEALGAGPVVSRPPSVTESPRDARAIAVLPFANQSPDPADEYLSDGLTDEIIAALAQLEDLHVVSRTSTFALKGKAQDVRAIGAALNVAFVVEGVVRRVGRRIRVTAQLIDAVDGRSLWSGRYDRETDELLSIEEDLARTIVATLRGLLVGDLGEPVSRRYTENPRAYHLYLKGRHAWSRRTREGVVDAVRFFEQALAEDPHYALARSGLADCYALQIDYLGVPVAEGMERARAEALQALALDEGLAEAHTSLAWITFLYDWDWARAEREFRRAIELNPRYATARRWYAWLLLATRRIAEAVTQARMALTLEPASVSIQRSAGWLLYYARQPDEAIAQLQRALILDPGAEETHRILGLAYATARPPRWTQAEASFAEALAQGPESAYALAGLGATYALAGRRAEAEGVLARLRTLSERRRISTAAFAMVTASLGDADATFAWLERAWQERRGWLCYLAVEPLLDPVRHDLRFSDWLTRMHLA